jgi:carboxypeptidase C (cathepsin A)
MPDSCTKSSKSKVRLPFRLVHADNPNRFGMVSGYVNVTSLDFLFYIYFPAAAYALIPAPVLLWTNGGPGCSAMEGAFTEISPLSLYGVFHGYNHGLNVALTENAYDWTFAAHLLFVDQPRYTGYSFGTGPYIFDSYSAGKDVVSFILAWRTSLFPEHESSAFMLASESYGGHYIPVFAEVILENNRLAMSKQGDQKWRGKIHVAGLLIGNGCIADPKPPRFLDLISLPWLWRLRPFTSNYSTDGNFHMPNVYDTRLQRREGFRDEMCNWLMQDGVRGMLHVCGNGWQEVFGHQVNGMCGCNKWTLFGGVFNERRYHEETLFKLLQSHICVTLYYGFHDLMCSFASQKPLLTSMLPNLSRTGGHAILPRHPRVGTIKQIRSPHGATLKLMLFSTGGHMLPRDDPYGGSVALCHAIPSCARNLYLHTHTASKICQSSSIPGELPSACILSLFLVYFVFLGVGGRRVGVRPLF